MTKQTTTKKTLGNKTGKALIRRISVKPISKNIQEFNPGDTVNVHVKVKEGEKERTQVFKGVVVKIQGSGSAKSFTVRKISSGVGVERTFPFRSSNLEKVEKLSAGKVRRAKLYYLRGLNGKAARIESDLVKTSGSTAE
ncbi:MAG: 50S ribosomal protein L19 [Bdellovibrionaceae bacterium]|jgi:large subunit ribosomal protein L19|nr:50S ribosomal protein L19 [Pseudobdellovibrionaceae bacterium]NUM59336.1 50S ribosomal protein L19 [Pseudobdellovibrionaceae bacterium]